MTRSRWTLALAVLLGASGSPGAELVTGTLEIRYHLAPASAEDLQPSYQTTIWPAANRAERRFVPEPYPEGEEILTGVEARFQP